MIGPNADELEAFHRISVTGDGKTILRYIERCLKDAVLRLAQEEKASRVRQLQGECRALRVLNEKLNPVSNARPGVE